MRTPSVPSSSNSALPQRGRAPHRAHVPPQPQSSDGASSSDNGYTAGDQDANLPSQAPAPQANMSRRRSPPRDIVHNREFRRAISPTDPNSAAPTFLELERRRAESRPRASARENTRESDQAYLEAVGPSSAAAEFFRLTGLRPVLPPAHLYESIWQETKDGLITLGAYDFHITHIPNIMTEDGLHLFVRLARNMGYGDGSITDVSLRSLSLGPMREALIPREQEEAYWASPTFQRASCVARSLRESHFDAYWNIKGSPDWESDDSEGSDGEPSEPESLPSHHSQR